MHPRNRCENQRECEASRNPLSKLLNQLNLFFFFFFPEIFGRQKKKSIQQEWAENLHLSPPPGRQISRYYDPQQES